MEKKKVPPM